MFEISLLVSLHGGEVGLRPNAVQRLVQVRHVDAVALKINAYV